MNSTVESCWALLDFTGLTSFIGFKSILMDLTKLLASVCHFIFISPGFFVVDVWALRRAVGYRESNRQRRPDGVLQVPIESYHT